MTDDEAQALACRAVDPACSPEDREAALAALASYIRGVAAGCACYIRAFAQARQDLIDQSVTHAGLALPTYDPGRPFRPWLQVVLTRHGQTIRRHQARDAGRRAALEKREEPAGHSTSEEGLGRLGERFADLREGLDCVAWPPARQVDYFAVLLVFCRVELVRLACRNRVCPPEEVARQVADWLPWHRQEEARSFRPGLPTLEALWGRLAPALGGNAGLGLVHSVLNGMGPARPVSYQSLAGWSFRAREQARDLLGDEDWHGLGLAGLLDAGGGRLT